MVKRETGSGPGWCCLCKNDCESVDHLFVYCQFTKVVWMEISNSFKLQIHWDKLNLLECMEFWMTDKFVSSHRALLVMCYGASG
jgi:hypothetical protein